jgi:chromate reductase
VSTLLFLSGSLRQGSVNAAAVRAARRAAQADPRVDRTAVLRLDVPFYDGDLEAAGVPRSVRAVREAVRSADALVVSTPSYNGAPPGVLKNLLDWLSRPAGAGALDGLLVATMSASPGRLGGLDAQQQLQTVLVRTGARLVDLDPPVAIADAVRKCGPTGELADAVALAEIERLVAATVSALHPTLVLAGATR